MTTPEIEEGSELHYRRDVQDIAKEILKESPSDLYDAIHEAVDGSWWVIYTYRARHVLLYSDNENAGFDELGKEFLQGCDSMSDAYSRAAYWAMRQDVSETIQELQDEAEDADETEDAKGVQS